MVVPGKVVPLLLLAGALSLSAQEAAPGADVEIGETIDVRVVNVEAVVTDRRGERVKRLSPSDFRLLVDGKEVPIDYFTEIRGGTATTAGGEGSGPPAPAEGVVGRNLLIFIDQSYTMQAQLDLVLQRFQEDLGRLGPGDQVAVVTASAKGRLKILTGWTSDAARLRAVLDQVRSEPTEGALLRASFDSWENDRALARMASLVGHERPGSVVNEDLGQWWDLYSARQPSRLSALESYSAAERGEPELWAEDAFGDTAIAALRAFSSAPGRKVMLLFSGGWPAGNDPRVIEAANLLGFSLYPVDVSGLQSSPVAVNASQMGPSAPDAQYSGFISSSWERRVHYGLEALARETGGKASLNGLRETALERTLDDTSSYYWIGFSPTWQADGRRHNIRLKVRRSGLDVRARRSYSDLSLRAKEALDTESRRVIEATGPEAR